MANQTGRQKRRAARAKRKHKRPEDKSEPITSPPPVAPVNPDTENKQNSRTITERKRENVRQKLRQAIERKKPVELAIVGVSTLAVLFWIITIIPIYKNRETWIIWTVYFALVLTILAFFLSWQKRVWDKSKTAQLIKDRPELSLEATRVFFRPGKHAEVRIVLMNRGTVAARNIWFGGVDFVVYAPFKGRLNLGHLPEMDSFPSLAVGASMTGFTREGTKTLTAKDVAEIQNGKLQFFHYSKGHYEDDAGNAYPIDFCLMYIPGRENLPLAPIEHWPKNESDEKAS
jgi:hypothetical protein